MRGVKMEQVIIIPVKEKKIYRYLESAPEYEKYTLCGNRVIKKERFVLDVSWSFINNLRQQNAGTIICGMLEGISRRELALSGITVYAGVYGNAEEQAEKLAAGTLTSLPDVTHGYFAVHYSPCIHGED